MSTAVLITGATSGIGKKLAQDYAASGVDVIACGRNQAALDELAAYSPRISCLQFDVTDYEQTKKALAALPVIPSTWIFNAGDCEYLDHGVVDAKLVARVMNVNVMGVVNCIEGCQHHFQAGHRLVIVGSIASELALPRAEAYGASKAAVSYFARSLALDLQPKGITVSVVFPGFVQTPLTDKNTFAMPMMISVDEASQAIRTQLSAGKEYLYFPAGFTTILRLIACLPYRWQRWLTSKLLFNKKDQA